MVSDDGAELGQSGVDLPALNLDSNRPVGVLEIAGGREGSDVHPFAEVAVPGEAVVILVREALKDGALDFPAHPAEGAYGGVLPYAPGHDPAVRTDVSWSLNEGERLDAGFNVDHDRPVSRVDDGACHDLGARPDKDVFALVNRGRSVDLARLIAVELLKIGPD